ncbi:MAG TPA: glycerophosphodiester phosphodiesterase [Steroidobacteraceae bacterium]|nr:glycerophosphodiester phosphodiesterase [Steroidobacteraceae bacterium]
MRTAALMAIGLLVTGSSAAGDASYAHRGNDREPIVIGHRGASGFVPEHTLVSYYIAMQQGADYVEPDLVSTRDGVLVARHENEIGGTTNVSEHSEFASRKKTKTIDGVSIEGWFTEDFTLAELKTLRARERIPTIRPDNARFDGQFEIPTFEEVIQLVEGVNESRALLALKQGKRAPDPIGIYPETKHPTYFDSIGLSLEEPLVKTLHRHGYSSKYSPVFIQSFEVGNLRQLGKMTRVPLVQLINSSGKPYDFVVSGDPRTYADLASAEGLKWIAKYADGVGINKDLIIPRNPDGTLKSPTAVVKDAHAAGLLVHTWTIRAENTFLPAEYRIGTDPTAIGDMAAEARKFLEAGVDGFFTDQAVYGVLARDAFVAK